MPPLTAIEAFVQVARQGSVKAAAEALALSPPALSRRVQSLERFMAQRLFDRVHQGVVLNAAGEALLTRLGPALDGMADAIADVVGGKEILRLRLSVLPLFASQQLMARLPELRRTHPELHLDIDTAAHGLARLGEGIDAAIVLAREVDPSLHARRITRNTVVAIGSRVLTDGAAAIREPDDLSRTTIFLHRDMPENFEAWRQALRRPDLEPAAVDHFDSGQLMLDAAAEGLGVAFMLDTHLADAHDARLVRLFDHAAVASPYSYWFACRRSSLGNPAVRIFNDWLFQDGRGPR